ncbi:MAG: hypothetical protein NTV50_02875 [Planctomycetota bacterium]|nr:hypothetical protein [Planctomycetota bacterium]
MIASPLLISLIGCFLFQVNTETIIVPALSSPEGVEASIQVKLLDERLPGAVFSILLKFETTKEVVVSRFSLEEKYKKDWELLPAGNESKTQTEGKAVQTIPFILRAKKTGPIDIPTLEASALLDSKNVPLVWENWLFPEKLFPFKELDTPEKNGGPIIDFHSPWFAIGLLILIALGVFGLVKKPPLLIPSELNITKELETWLKKVDALSLEECITTLDPVLRTEPANFKGLTPSQRLLLENALQAIEEIKYSKNKDRATLKSAISELVKNL